MKLRITPLNFATAFLLIFGIYVWFSGASVVGFKHLPLGTAIGWVFILFAFVVSFLDIIFRNFFQDIKKLWLIELSFITLTAILFLILRH